LTCANGFANAADNFDNQPDEILCVGEFHALNTTNLDIKKGEIFALLGPNGAGKTTLISIICGIVTATTGFRHRRRT